ncbi:hypothetical protein ACIPM0_15880 [Pseudomonas sichuanensis]|uniref:hypothetical protein n=1 Tax=Pseudomonas sichuanensis TaxID=2213015 RepID=UPI00380842BF
MLQSDFQDQSSDDGPANSAKAFTTRRVSDEIAVDQTLPLAPDRFIGPFDAINPRTICTLTVLLMGAGALGHIALRVVGAHLSAIALGFVSSSTNIALIGHLALSEPSSVKAFSAAAISSNLATSAMLTLVLGTYDPAYLGALWAPILLAALTTVACGSLLQAPSRYWQ